MSADNIGIDTYNTIYSMTILQTYMRSKYCEMVYYTFIANIYTNMENNYSHVMCKKSTTLRIMTLKNRQVGR